MRCRSDVLPFIASVTSCQGTYRTWSENQPITPLMKSLTSATDMMISMYPCPFEGAYSSCKLHGMFNLYFCYSSQGKVVIATLTPGVLATCMLQDSLDTAETSLKVISLVTARIFKPVQAAGNSHQSLMIVLRYNQPSSSPLHGASCSPHAGQTDD